MPSPLQSLRWQLESVERGVKESEGKPQITKNALRAFGDLQRSLNNGQDFTRAISQEIAWQDGRTFPWAVGGDFGGIEPAVMPDFTSIRPPIRPPRNDATRAFDGAMLYAPARALDDLYQNLFNKLGSATLDGKLTTAEAKELKPVLDALQAASGALTSAVQARYDLKKDSRTPSQIFQQIKNVVNEKANDETRGTFGLLTRFNKDEAVEFMSEMKRQGLDLPTIRAVMEELYDTAVSPFGDLILNRHAVKALEEQAQDWGITGLDWSKAIESFKDDHPIVALYSVAIDDALNGATGNNVRELRAMLRAGEAAANELGPDFIRNGPVALGAATLSGEAAAMAEATPSERATEVAALNKSLRALRARIAQLEAQ